MCTDESTRAKHTHTHFAKFIDGEANKWCTSRVGQKNVNDECVFLSDDGVEQHSRNNACLDNRAKEFERKKRTATTNNTRDAAHLTKRQ